jgi:hypothetical protein
MLNNQPFIQNILILYSMQNVMQFILIEVVNIYEILFLLGS